MRATIYLTQNTGITAGHVKYLEGSAEGFFTGKTVLSKSTVDLIRAMPSKYGFEVGSAHLKGELEDFEQCDFLCYKNEKSGVFFVNAITSIEKVNSSVGGTEASCRIHFTLDYWHTYSPFLETGYAFVQQTHIPKREDTIGAYLTIEPVSPPMCSGDYHNSNLEGAVAGIMASPKYIAYLSADKYGNANTPETGFKVYQGAPVWASVKAGSSGDIAGLIKSYLNQRGNRQINEIPTMTNIQCIVAAPSAVIKEGMGEWVPCKMILTQAQIYPELDRLTGYVWKKIFSPQFLGWEISALTSGHTMHLDISKMAGWKFGSAGQLANITFDTKITITGGLDGQIGLGLWYEGNDAPRSPDESITQSPFPRIPVFQYQNSPQTSYPVNKAMIRGVASGGGITSRLTAAWNALASGGAAAVNGGINNDGIGGKLQGIGGGTASGLLGGVGGLAYGNEGQKAMDNYLESMDNTWGNYTVQGSGGVGWQTMLGYTFNTTMKRPTSEGLYMLNSFFHRFGYTVNRQMKLNFKVNSNFTYLKIAGGATFTTQKAPAIAVEKITEMLNNGLTIWAAEIGSTDQC